ncbi:MAG: PP2C family protein-serine/threonine phosphatase [Planctomycetota bacterium]
MSTKTPKQNSHKNPHLRLHVEEPATPVPNTLDAAWLADLRRSFAAATGWTLDWDERPARGPGRRFDPSARQEPWLRPTGNSLAGLHLGEWTADTAPPTNTSCSASPTSSGTSPASSHSSPAIPKALLQPLVQSLNHLLLQLTGARGALKHREAELAAAIPVGQQRPSGRQLALRLEELLRSITAATQMRAAGLYLLDDATSVLKLRAGWGLPPERHCEPPRSLRGQLGDLEALLGHTLAIPDSREQQAWNPPEPCAAAMCVAIASQSVPLGTIWLFGDEPRSFSGEQIALLEFLAGRIAVELERDTLAREIHSLQHVRRQWQSAVRWQRQRLPSPEPLSDDWQIAGSAGSSGRLTNEFYDWEMLPTGQLALTVARADGNSLEGSLTTAALHAALKTLNPICHDPRQLLRRLNETCYRSSAGGATSSLIHASISPDTGAARLLAVGDVTGLLIRGEQMTTIKPQRRKLGETPETFFRIHQQQLEVGDLLILGCGRLAAPAEPAATENAASPPALFALPWVTLVRLLTPLAATASAAQIVEAIQAAVLEADDFCVDEPQLIVVRRRSSTT